MEEGTLEGSDEVGLALDGVAEGVVDELVSETPVDRFALCLRNRAIASSRGSATTCVASNDEKTATEMILNCFILTRCYLRWQIFANRSRIVGRFRTQQRRF